MPNYRDIKLEKYGISVFEYRELHNFCLQYSDKKKRIAELRNPLKSQQYTDMPHGSDVGNPTEQAALIAASLSKDCDLIEQTAIETDGGIYQYLILGVTQQGISYEILRALKNIPCGREYYYKQRRKFFYLLLQKKGVI